MAVTGKDGGAIFGDVGLHSVFYDVLFGNAPSLAGDIAFYDATAGGGRCRILDAACGTGRIFAGLAREGRSIVAFDASPVLLRTARQRAAALGGMVPGEVTQQRLEAFTLPGVFDLIVVGYYGFSCILNAAGRLACLVGIARHLAPQGRAVLHLPAADLLAREVPAHELDAMRSAITVPAGPGTPVMVLEHDVMSMRYDPVDNVRSIETEVRLLDADRRPLRRDRATMHYARVTEDELRHAAAEAGLRVVQSRSGFVDAVRSELIVILARGNGVGR